MRGVWIGLILAGLILGIYILKRTTESGRALIKREEGLCLTIYTDKAGHPTIGYGHKILAGENFSDGITRQHAEDILTNDLVIAENTINQYVNVPLTQNQFNALVSFVFNIGVNGFLGSTALVQLNQGNYSAAADWLLPWDKITKNGVKVVWDVLKDRRSRERELFLT